MKQVTRIGLDIAKSVFQVHGVDAAGQAVLRQPISNRDGAQNAAHILNRYIPFGTEGVIALSIPSNAFDQSWVPPTLSAENLSV